MENYDILMQAPVAICIFRGDNYTLEFANDAYLHVLGRTRDIVGKPLFESFPELANQGIKALIDGVMESGLPCSINEHEATTVKNGVKTQQFFNCIYQPLLSETGVITGVIVVFTEVTELVVMKIKQTENQKQLAEKLGIANLELAYQKEEKGKRAAELGIANIELAFQNDEKEKRADELGIANIELAFQDDEKGKRAAELGIANIELAFQNDEKEKRAGELFIANKELIFQNGEKEKRAAELALADIELVFQNKEKEKREIANRELQAAKIEAENATKIAENATIIANEAVKAKQQFLSTMSHEIRTPMNAIIGFTKVLLKTDLTTKQNEYLNAIKISGDALIVLINDILDLAKVDAGKMTFERKPFKLAASLSAMLYLFDTKIQEKNLVLIKEYDDRIPDVLVGDAVRLHQIILNLMSNAIKFTTKGRITVSAVLLKEDAQNVTIEFAVKDTGIGITDDKMTKIFDNFQQASSETARLFGGTGLGLAIVKQLVEAQGGKVSVTSKITEGSRFSFTLTFLKTDDTAEFHPELIELNTDHKNIKILVVEDMKLNQLLMQTILDDFGFAHDMADNGLIAVEKLKNNDYDIILMDLQMPEMNGFEATEYIRNTLKLTVPIIALTADVTTVDVAKCKTVGMNDYVSKPLDERILYAKIMGLVAR
jgi:signal transduction histidine kinase/CheY-like chemotaxis protein